MRFHVGFVHDTYHKYRKLGPKRRKCIFIRHSKQSKGYELIGEQSNISLTEIGSRDVDFIEYEFPCRGEVNRSLELHEIVGQEKSTKSGLVENEKEILILSF